MVCDIFGTGMTSRGVENPLSLAPLCILTQSSMLLNDIILQPNLCENEQPVTISAIYNCWVTILLKVVGDENDEDWMSDTK